MGYINPLLRLNAAQQLLELSPEQRAALPSLLRELRAEADRQAEYAWRKRDRWPPTHAPFDPGHCEAALIDEGTAKPWVMEHHYSGSYPAARLRVGLFLKERPGHQRAHLVEAAGARRGRSLRRTPAARCRPPSLARRVGRRVPAAAGVLRRERHPGNLVFTWSLG